MNREEEIEEESSQGETTEGPWVPLKYQQVSSCLNFLKPIIWISEDLNRVNTLALRSLAMFLLWYQFKCQGSLSSIAYNSISAIPPWPVFLHNNPHLGTETQSIDLSSILQPAETQREKFVSYQWLLDQVSWFLGQQEASPPQLYKSGGNGDCSVMIESCRFGRLLMGHVKITRDRLKCFL